MPLTTPLLGALSRGQQFPLIQKTSCIAHYLLVFPRFHVFEQDFGVRLVAVAWKRIDVAGGFGAFKVLGERMGGPTSRWFDQFGGSFSVPERNHLVHVFPVRDLEVEHMAAEFLPEVEWTLGLFAGHSEQLAASLFGLIDEEREVSVRSARDGWFFFSRDSLTAGYFDHHALTLEAC